MKISTFFAALAMSLAPMLANAQLKNADGNANVAKVKEANQNLSSMQSPFVRTVNVAAISQKTTSDGTFYFVSPSKLSMKYSDGESMVITADNVSITQANGQSRTLKSGNHHVEDLSETLLACVKGDVAAIDGKLISSKAAGKSIVFKIESDIKVGRSKYTSLELAYDSSDCSLVSVTLQMKDGSFMKYDLTSKTVNKPIDDSIFTHAKKNRK